MKIPTLLTASTAIFLTAVSVMGPSRLLAADSSVDLAPDADTRLMNPAVTKEEETPKGDEKLMGVFLDRDRSLLYFDLSSIPKNAKITSAVLQLTAGYLSYTNPKGAEMGVYRVTKLWDEGAATWSKAESGTSWEHPGGDAVGTTGTLFEDPYATNDDTGESDGKKGPKLDWNITGLVSEWVSGKFPNYGLMIKTHDKSNCLHFCTKESTEPESQPVLKIQFSK